MRALPFVAVLSLPLLPTSSLAQCLGSEGLDSAPCCAPVVPLLPSFPPISLQGQGDCWAACNPPILNCLQVDVTPPTPGPTCGQYIAQFSARDCGGPQLLSGALDLVYSRTWDETPVPGATPVQVWRFHAKVDLVRVPGSPALCPVPSCLPAQPAAFFYGYVDYAFDCGAGVWESSLVLFHNCDAFIHDPALSATPGSFHPTTTYAIVAPDTFANPFIPSSAPAPPAGPLIAEALRTSPVGLPPPTVCLAEDFLAAGAWVPLVFGCLCPLSLVPVQNSGVLVNGSGSCGGAFSSINAWPFVPWFHFVTTSIGTWTSSASYPGPERVSVGEGLFNYKDVCDPTGVTLSSLDVLYGSVTEGGYTVSPNPLFPTSQTFIDLASNYRAVLPGSVPLPLVGFVSPTHHIVYVNR